MKRSVLTLMLAAAVLIACSGDNGTQIASGPVATTPPLALPIELKTSVPETSAGAPTTATPTAEADSTTAVPAPTTPEPDVTPPGATPLPLPTPVPSVVPEATSVPTASPPPTSESTAVATDTGTTAATPAPAGSPTPTPFPPSPDGARIPLVDIDVVNVFTGEIEPLTPKSPAGVTLFYFWTPSCPQCLIDAPDIAQFARENPRLKVVALGAGAKPRDTVELAQLFPERTGITNDGTMIMVYDTSYRSWQQFGVVDQPHWILYDRTGAVISSQAGTVDFNLVGAVLE